MRWTGIESEKAIDKMRFISGPWRRGPFYEPLGRYKVRLTYKRLWSTAATVVDQYLAGA